MKDALKNTARRGFTLIELLVAAVLVGIVMIATFQTGSRRPADR